MSALVDLVFCQHFSSFLFNFCSNLLFLFIVPTFDTKVAEYLCSGGFFFQTNFDFLTSHF